jgi:hypothetical protein
LGSYLEWEKKKLEEMDKRIYGFHLNRT